MKIFDCFTLFNEFDLLRLRIRLLADHVDHFVVVEATQTHSGQPKDLLLSQPECATLLKHPRVHRVVVDFPGELDNWGREQFQREAIGRGLQELEAHPEDLVLVSDIDEIPQPRLIRRAAEILEEASGPRPLVIFEQRLFYFRLNYELVWSRKLPWLGSVAARMGDIRSVNGLRTTGRGARGRNARDFDAGAQVLRLPHGGWHFSYLGGDEALDAKLSAYAHQEHNTAHHRGASVAELITRRRGLHEREGLHQVWAVISPSDIGIDLPTLVRLGLDRFIEHDADSIGDVLARVGSGVTEVRLRMGPLAIGLK